ncbi:MAG: septum formation inhibitor Maf [Gammaproteobacteria bacterium]|nr:septum formation inhibitor Maf [Gammaproteobacteria bacterium]
MKIVLASQSPRRKELLSFIVDDFDVQAADIDETPKRNESAIDYVARLAAEKAQAVAEKLEQAVVIGSDTSVVIDGLILGKPMNFEDCRRMLTALSGRSHQVLTAFSIIANNKVYSEVVATEVNFVEVTEQAITSYWQTGEPQDKAGSYAIQGIGGKFVKGINGSVTNVIGLPLAELEQALNKIL